MKTELIQTEIEKVERRGSHVQALLAALVNPSEWTYTGMCVDAGGSDAKCACGHPIRWCFLIEHPTLGQTQVGSTCIENIAGINPELGAALVAAREKLEADLKAAQAQARRTAAEAECAALWIEYSAIRDELENRARSYRESRLRVGAELWSFVFGRNRKYFRRNCPEYSRPCDLKRWLVQAIARASSVRLTIGGRS